MNATSRTPPPNEPITPPEPVEPPQDAGPEEIEKHIEKTRGEVGETVEAIAHKLDVKSQAQERVSALRGRAGDIAEETRAAARQPRTRTYVAGVAAAATVGAVIVMRRRR